MQRAKCNYDNPADALFVWQGRFREALANFEQVVAGDRSSMSMLNIHGWDSVALALIFIGLCRWHLGHPDEDLAVIAQGVERARTQGNTFTMGLVRLCACVLRLLRRESAAAKTEAELLTRLDDDLGMQGDSVAKAFSACATLQETPTLSALAELSEIVRGFRSQDTKLMSPSFSHRLPKVMAKSARLTPPWRKLPTPSLWSKFRPSASGKPNSLDSRASCFRNAIIRICPKPRPASATQLKWRAARRPKCSNCARPPASRGCSPGKGREMRRARCSPKSTTGSLKASTRRI